MFYKKQDRIKIELELTSNHDILNYIKENNEMPAKYYFDKYNLIELHINEFRFNKTMIKRMIKNNIIDDDFIDDETNMINPYYEFRYLGNIFDFKNYNICNDIISEIIIYIRDIDLILLQ